MKRRRLLAGGLALASVGRASAAEPYPTKPVRWVVPYPAGAFTDAAARVIGKRLSERLGQQFVIDNKTGAGSNIGTEIVANALPDGHTLLFISTANVINTALYKTLPFNFRRDILPVAGLVRMPQLIVVNPAVPATTTAEFIAYCKANPGKVNMASAGIGTGNHLAGEIFQSMTGTKLTHVPYRGTAPAMADLIAGQVQVSSTMSRPRSSMSAPGRSAPSPPRPGPACRCCPRSRRSPIRCLVTRQFRFMAWACPRARRWKSSKSSIARSISPWPTPKLPRSSPDRERSSLSAAPPILAP